MARQPRPAEAGRYKFKDKKAGGDAGAGKPGAARAV